jgi:hypothetical protein
MTRNYSETYDIPVNKLPKRAEAIWSTRLTDCKEAKKSTDSESKTTKNNPSISQK